MDAKRIIPVLELSGGQVLAGRGPRHPAEWAGRLALEGADGIIFREIPGRGQPGRWTRAEWIRDVAGSLFLSFALEASFGRLRDLEEALEAGADRVILDAGAASSPILAAAFARFGRQRLAVAVDAFLAPSPLEAPSSWRVALPGPSPERDALAWMAELEQAGAGEILLSAAPESEAAGLFQDSARLGLSIVCRSGGDPALAADALLHGADAVAFPAGPRTSQHWKSLLADRGLPLRY